MAGGARRMGERVLAYAGHVAEKARYGGIPRLFVDGLDLLGVTIRPFYVYQEGAAFHDGPVAVPAGYEVGHLAAADMPEVAAIPNRPYSLRQLVGRLEDGQRCIGARFAGRVVGFTWYSVRECHFEGYRFPLGPDEAYLFDAYVAPDHRGRGLAACLRRLSYAELRAAGRTRFYSITDAFNRSAKRYKKKLGGRPILLAVHVCPFGWVKYTKVLRHYG